MCCASNMPLATIEVRIMHGHILQVHQQEQTSLRLTTFSCMTPFARGVTEGIDLSLIRRDHEWVMIGFPICICEREVQVGTPMSMAMEHTFNPHATVCLVSETIQQTTQSVSTPWNLASNMLEALSLKEILSDEAYCQASGDVQCFVHGVQQIIMRPTFLPGCAWSFAWHTPQVAILSGWIRTLAGSEQPFEIGNPEKSAERDCKSMLAVSGFEMLKRIDLLDFESTLTMKRLGGFWCRCTRSRRTWESERFIVTVSVGKPTWQGNTILLNVDEMPKFSKATPR